MFFFVYARDDLLRRVVFRGGIALSLPSCIYVAEISTIDTKWLFLFSPDEPISNQVNLQELPEEEL